MLDYGITYYAAFPGCSAESEASFETISYLSQQVSAYSLPAVIILENSDPKIAETVITASKKHEIKIVTINSLQSVTKFDIKNGITYLDIMKKNLDALLASLSE